MREWTVGVEWDAEAPVTNEALDALMEAAGVATGEPGNPRVGTRVTVDAWDAPSAAADVIKFATAVIPGAVASIEVLTIEEDDRRLAMPALPELVGISEVATILGVTRQRASALQGVAGFPAPVAVLASGPVFRRGDLSRFEESWARKPGRPPSDSRTRFPPVSGKVSQALPPLHPASRNRH